MISWDKLYGINLKRGYQENCQCISVYQLDAKLQKKNVTAIIYPDTVNMRRFSEVNVST